MKKVLKIFIVVVLFVFVSACGDRTLKSIEKALLKNETLDNYKVEVNLKVTENEYNETIEEKLIYFINFKEKTAHFIDNSHRSYYLMKDCISDTYSVQYLPWNDFVGTNYLSGISSDSYNFSLKDLEIITTTENDVTEYTITVPDDYINEFVKENINLEELESLEYTNYVISIKVDSKGYWTNLNLTFDYSIETYSGHTEISYNILATGEEAKFLIPQETKENIYSYYDKYTYKGPRSYQYERRINLENPDQQYENNDAITYFNNVSSIKYFDKVSKTLIVTGWQSKAVYSAITAEEVYDISSYPNEYAYGNGLLVEVTELYSGQQPIRYRITTYDLKTKASKKSIEISGNYLHYFEPYNVSGNILITDTNNVNNQRLTAFMDTYTGKSYYSEVTLGSTARVVNYKDNILYCEDSNSTYFDGESTLQYVDITTGKVIKTITVTGITDGYQTSSLKIIGDYLFFYDKIYDLKTGEVISNSPLMKNYSALSGFTPTNTIYTDNKYDIVSGYSESGKEIAIYDNEINKYVFRAAGEFRSAEYEGGTFYLINYNGYAIIDTNQFDGELESNMGSGIKITKDANDKYTKLTFPANYTDIDIDGNYLFVGTGKSVKVFDINTYNLIKEINFTNDVYRIDAYEGTLAVSFGKNKFIFSLVDLESWIITNVTTEKGVTDIQVYNNKIYFTGQDYWDNIFYYDNETKKIDYVNNRDFSGPYFTINKDKGIMYIAETGSSSSDFVYYDLKNNKTIYESTFGLYDYNNFPIIYDGSYVHYFGKMYDSITGERFYKEDYERLFPNSDQYEYLGALYYDRSISVIVALKDGKKVTLVYGLINKTITETTGDAERVIRYNNKFIIVRPDRNDLYIVN